MSISAVSGASFLNNSNQNVISHREAIQQDFQQIGKDLQAGDLSAAQSDFATLQQLVPKLDATTPQSADPRVKAFAQLEQDLQAGNLSAAQQDYSNIQQIFQQRAAHFHHHHHNGGMNGAPGGVEPEPQPASPSLSVSA